MTPPHAHGHTAAWPRATPAARSAAPSPGPEPIPRRTRSPAPARRAWSERADRPARSRMRRVATAAAPRAPAARRGRGRSVREPEAEHTTWRELRSDGVGGRLREQRRIPVGVPGVRLRHGGDGPAQGRAVLLPAQDAGRDASDVIVDVSSSSPTSSPPVPRSRPAAGIAGQPVLAVRGLGSPPADSAGRLPANHKPVVAGLARSVTTGRCFPVSPELIPLRGT
jgi:hypothetical protein